jgi:hypothetical protein
VLLPTTLAAQQDKSAATRNDVEARRNREQDLQEREYEMRSITKTVKRHAPPPSVVPQIQEDFRALQHVDYEMLRELKSKPALDYELIARATKEIHKRAERLRENLMLALLGTNDEEKQAQESPVPADDAQVKAALLKLDGTIMSFTGNPQFKGSHTLDVQQVDKAAHDLDDILALSRALKKSAEQLRKSAP